MRLGTCLPGLALLLLSACQIPFLHNYEPRDPPTDSFGCGPNASADELSGSALPEGVQLSWTSEAVNEDGFIVERSVANSPAWLEVGRTATDETTFVDIGAEPDTDYVYRIRSFRVVDTEDCVSSPSGSIAQLSGAAAPTNLNGVAQSSTTIELSWDDDNTHPSVAYRLRRRVGQQSFVDVGSIEVPETSFLDTALSTAVTYEYAVSAINAAGEGPSALVSVTAWQNPILAWSGNPTLGPTCQLDIDGTATIAPGTNAGFDSASGTIALASGTVVADSTGLSALIDDFTPGLFDTSWTVTDDFGASSTLNRQLELVTTPQQRGRLSAPQLLERQSEGRQALYPGCADCDGPAGQIALGAYHACSVVDGELLCWGDNLKNQMAQGENLDRTSLVPRPMCAGDAPSPCAANATSVARLELNVTHSCFLNDAGELRCWGANSWGQLGDGTNLDRLAPTPVCEGGGGPGCVPLSAVTDFDTGTFHTCAIVGPTGRLLCWGRNDDAQLGSGTADDVVHQIPRPVCLSGSHAGGDCVPLDGAIAVGTGDDSTCVVLNTGDSLCWGSDRDEQLGSLVPSEFVNPAIVCTDPMCGTGRTDFVAVASGYIHHCGLRDDTSVECWGNNGTAQLGNDSFAPQAFPQPVCAPGVGECGTLTGVVQLVAGNDFNCGLLQSSEVVCWGYNTYGQIGFNSSGESYAERPEFVCESGSAATDDCVPLSGVTKIDAGDTQVCAIMANQEVRCWGRNYYGQFATGGWNSSVHVPVPMCQPGSNWDGTICDDGASLHTPVDNVVDIAVGARHICIVDSTRDVWCAGGNTWGELGDGGVAFESYELLWVVDNADAISANRHHTCIRQGTQALCWGRGDSGQLGNGASDEDLPASVCESGAWDGVSCAGGAPLDSIAEIFTGHASTCVIRTNGELWCFGGNHYGELGIGVATADENLPAPVCLTGTAGTCTPTVVTQAGLGDDSTCAVLSGSNELRCWGFHGAPPLGTGPGPSLGFQPTPVCTDGFGAQCVPMTGAVEIAAATRTYCALLASGEVRCWGDDADGQTGDGSSGSDTGAPTPVCASGSWDGTSCAGGGPLTGVDTLTAGEATFCAQIGTDALCWGYNGYDQIGLGPSGSTRVSNPTAPCDPTGCGNGALTGIQSISPGHDNTCATLTNGDVLCWGYNYYGQLGTNDTDSVDLPVPVCDPGDLATCNAFTGMSVAASGGDQSCAIAQADGALHCWGNTHSGGYTPTLATTPTRVCLNSDGITCDPLTDVELIGTGMTHTCVVDSTGAGWCFGSAFYGELGNGIDVNNESGTPQRVCMAGAFDGTQCTDGTSDTTLNDIVSIAAGGMFDPSINALTSHSCAITGDGLAWCWGYNYFGELGDGTDGGGPNLFRSVASPVVCDPGPAGGVGCDEPGPLRGVVKIGAGGQHTCAILESGALKCWGRNQYGQLGTGDFNDSPIPLDVDLGGERALDVTGGEFYTCVLLESGRAACWGRNNLGQLGIGTVSSSGGEATPRFVCASGSGATCSTLDDLIAIDAGLYTTCAIDAQGMAYCWGDSDDTGVLGNGQSDSSLVSATPVRVCEPTPPPNCGEDPLDCAPLTAAVAIGVGEDFACALLEDGEARCWGAGAYGLRGDGQAAPAGVFGRSLGQCTPVRVCPPGTPDCQQTGGLTGARVQTCDVASVELP